VCREHAVAVLGPPATEVFDPIPRDVVLSAIVDELRWAKRHASTGYAVLNACRAKRFAVDGRLVSKVAGGEWYLARHGPDPVVSAALGFQRYGQPPPDKAAARRFLTRVTDYVRRS
jgi:streptomycin 3"-adenylyltransferase